MRLNCGLTNVVLYLTGPLVALGHKVSILLVAGDFDGAQSIHKMYCHGIKLLSSKQMMLFCLAVEK